MKYKNHLTSRTSSENHNEGGNNKPWLGDTLIVSIPMVFISMMILALLVMSYASVELVGKALVRSEESRVSQVAHSIALAFEKDQVYVEQLTKSLGQLALSSDNLAEVRQRIHKMLRQELRTDLVISGGIWPEPYTLVPQQERASLFWRKTPNDFRLLDHYNKVDEPLYSESVWYLASRYVPDSCFWTSVYTNPLTKKPVITCARAMYIQDLFAGVASLDVSMELIDTYLDEHMADVKGYALILDRNLRIIAKPDRPALLRQLGFDMGEQDTLFPAYLETIHEQPAFAAIERLIAKYQIGVPSVPLSPQLAQAFSQPASNYSREQPDNVQTYLNSVSLSEHEPELISISRDPVFGEAAEVVLVQMSKLGAYLVIVVPEKHILSQSTSALSGLFLVMLVAIMLTIFVLWLWLRHILLLPLGKMVKHLRSHQEEPLDTDQKYEIRALALAYNDKQHKLNSSVRELERAHKRYQSILHNSSEAIAVISEQGELLEANEALLALFNDDWTSVRGSTFESHLISQDRARFSSWMASLVNRKGVVGRIEASILTSGQQIVLMEISASVSQQEDSMIVTLFMRDVSVRREAERAIARMAVTDSLTGLYNRAGFTQRLEETLNAAKLSEEKVALLFIDLDYFKEINDVRGHEVGDQLLQLVAQRLNSRCRDSDIVARLGGDEFAIILSFPGEQDMINRFTDEVVLLLNKPFNLEGQETCQIGASVGVSIYPDYADNVTELVKQADIAMYQVKSDGRNAWNYYAKEQADAHQRRQQLIQEMNQAVENNEFYLDYQPIIDASGQLAFLEALIRWRHPQRGLISPREFISLAEKTGLIVEIGSWVIKNACQCIKDWHKAGMQSVVVSVNISVVQLQRGNLLRTLEQSLQHYALEPDCLLLEVTESLLLDASYASALQTLRQRGFRIAIDDFGTGYSSLSCLQMHPVDYLKIDKAFVDALSQDPESSLCRAIIRLSKGLGAKVIAEGVEEAVQFQQLVEMKSDYMQGYWIFKPMSRFEVVHWTYQPGIIRSASPLK